MGGWGCGREEGRKEETKKRRKEKEKQKHQNLCISLAIIVKISEYPQQWCNVRGSHSWPEQRKEQRWGKKKKTHSVRRQAASVINRSVQDQYNSHRHIEKRTEGKGIVWQLK